MSSTPANQKYATFKAQVLPALIKGHIDELARWNSMSSVVSTQSPGVSQVAQGLHALMQIEKMLAGTSSGTSPGPSGNGNATAPVARRPAAGAPNFANPTR